ncbi:SocA family protein [Pseudomonas gingeri]|uniref:SocA family protein n=2 Tax=Pseudomonas gingeri TaxID=117681 RepID=A0A7Y8C297_9PSED|nr:type II toxin-antitoxin system antitoxin SocA domain-containing protein [Pseudomonas gingeri]NWB96077.1 SocA family protein [Pseudomonas gingeri]
MALHKAMDIANWFVAKCAGSGDLITNLKVQKLLYYAEAWTQTLIDKELFPEQIQAWAHGPVVPEVFQEFKKYGWSPLPTPEDQKIPIVSAEAEDILIRVFEAYADLPAKTLESMTHKDVPWMNARGSLSPEERCEVVMPKSEICEFFRTKYTAEIDGSQVVQK